MTHTPQLTLTVDLPALARNYALLAAKVGAHVVTAAAVKANAYGTGVERVIQTLDTQKCPLYFVANMDEALTARALTPSPIAILGGLIAPDNVHTCTHHHLIPVINTPDQMTWVARHAPTLPVIIHVDTGMNRLGLSANEVDKACHTDVFRSLNIQYVMSHFACSDEKDHSLNHLQSTLFTNLLTQMRVAAGRDIPGSLSNSSGIFRDAAYHHQMVRPGYALYGGNPTPETTNPMESVVTLTAKILQIRDTAPAGHSVGYGATHTLGRPTKIATLALGYADGLIRSTSNRGHVFINGHPCPIIGRVSMDLTTIDITDYPANAPAPVIGGEAEIIGPHQGIDALAAPMGTIGYEVLTQLSRRATRIYL